MRLTIKAKLAGAFAAVLAIAMVLGVVGTEGIGADQLGQGIGMVGVGGAHGAHLVENHLRACFGRLPCGL